MDTVSTNICMGCLSVDRKLNPLNEECKQTFCGFLDLLDQQQPISLCFECLALLNRALCFKKQVKYAYTYLFGYLFNQNKPKSLTKLNLRNTVCLDNLGYSLNEGQNNVVINYKVSEFTEQSQNANLCASAYDKIKYEASFDQKTQEYKQTSEKFDQKTNDQEPCKSREPLAFIKVEDLDGGIDDHDILKAEPAGAEPVFSDSDDEPLTVKSKKYKDIQKRSKHKNECVRKKRKSKEQASGVVRDPRVAKKLRDLNIDSGHIALVMLTWEEVAEERRQMMQSVQFTRHAHRCLTCGVGYNHIHKLLQHNRKHTDEAGTEVCDICTIRCKTSAALASHRRRHRARWVCLYCEARYSQACVAADHTARVHSTPPATHRCPHCTHTDSSLGALRMHIKSHSSRPECSLCGKSFRDKSSLRTHAFVHRGEKEHACAVCDKRFMFKKQKEIHEITHKEHQHLYCHQCDVSFKNQTSYYQHMKYNLKHIDPADIKHACQLCDKRFVKAKRLEEHNLAVHLKLAPIKCTAQDCTFACPSRAALRSHVRLVHRGARALRNHVCHRCGHTYKSKKSLDTHLRSHNTALPLTQTRVDAPA